MSVCDADEDADTDCESLADADVLGDGALDADADGVTDGSDVTELLGLLDWELLTDAVGSDEVHADEDPDIETLDVADELFDADKLRERVDSAVVVGVEELDLESVAEPVELIVKCALLLGDDVVV